MIGSILKIGRVTERESHGDNIDKLSIASLLNYAAACSPEPWPSLNKHSFSIVLLKTTSRDVSRHPEPRTTYDSKRVFFSAPSLVR